MNDIEETLDGTTDPHQIGIAQQVELPYSYAGRFGTAPAPVTGMSGVWKITFDVFDKRPAPRRVFDTPEDNVEELPDSLYRSEETPRLTEALDFLKETMEPFLTGMFFDRDEPLLTTLANRAVFAGNAPDKIREAVGDALDDAGAPGYFLSGDTLPSLTVNNVDLIVVPVGQTVLTFIKNRLTLEAIPQADEVGDFTDRDLGIRMTVEPV